ncbi:MAG: ATP-dependent helicase/nuclease subunit B, partial [Verrucomicrobiales bacterium]
MGMHFDGHTPTGAAALGESIVGPLGMLQLLEARLGLSRPSIRPVERLVEARQALAAWYAGGGNHGNDSFERDSLAVAELFLRQRDELMMAGWDGKSALEGSLRLEAIHGFSQNLSDLVCQGEADRLAAISEALEQRPLRWESVTVVEPLKQIP